MIIEEQLAWFCLRAKPKCEHIAAGHLKSNHGLDVFAPQIRFRRPTARGAAWFTEPLFPSYLFAKFRFQEYSRLVHYSPGIRGLVHFGKKWPTVPEAAIEELREIYGSETVHVINPVPQAGDQVEIASGAFHGLNAVVTRVMPAKERVVVLLEFLGRQTQLEIDLQQVIREKLH